MTDKLRDDLAEVRKLQLRFHELEDGDDRDSVGVTGDLMAGEFVENYHAQIQRNAEDTAGERSVYYEVMQNGECTAGAHELADVIGFYQNDLNYGPCEIRKVVSFTTVLDMRANGGEVES